MKCMNHKNRFMNKSYFNILKKSILEFVRIDRLDFLLLLGISLITVAINFIILYSYKNIFSGIINSNQKSNKIVSFILIYVLVILISKLKSSFFDRYYVQYVSIPRFEKIMKNKIQKLTSNVNPIEFEKGEFYSKVHEANFTSTNIFRTVEGFFNQISLILNFIIVGGFFIKYDKSYLFFVIFSILQSFIESRISVYSNKKLREKLNIYERREDDILKSIYNENYAKENAILGINNYLFQKFSSILDKESKDKMKYSRKNFKVKTSLNILKSILRVFVVIILIRNYIISKDFGVFVTSFIAFKMLSDNTSELLELQEYLSLFTKMTIPYFNYIESYINMKDADKYEMKENIILEDVKFSYPQRENVLKDINLKINKGEVVAIVGANGSGKTTLSKIILQLYNPTVGKYYIDDKLINNYINNFKNNNWKTALFQDFSRYPLSLIDNVKVSDYNKNSCDTAIDILKKLNFSNEDIYNKSLLSLDIGNRNLSGGQWQKLALARMIYRDKNFVVLDEPTSMIDPIYERDFFDTIKEIIKNKTAIIITHKLQSIKFVDKVILMEDGKINDIDTHYNLLEKSDLYRNLWNARVEVYNSKK